MQPRGRSPSKALRRIPRHGSYKLRRNVTRLIKLCILLLFTSFMTIITYKLMRTYFPTEKISYEQFQMFKGEKKGSSGRKIDWHDYENIAKEKLRTGFGEQGVAAALPASAKKLVDELYKANGYNGALSDQISLNRSVSDIRHPDCAKKLYRDELPYVSVVVPFHNEHLSTLLRTAHSVLNRSPAHLIKEIILVDDFSSKELLKKPLDDYLSHNISKVRVLRLPERRGLIIARVAGAKAATGQVLIFLDAHTEANVNWLPPLLEPIAEDYKTCVCPYIDVIDYETFKYNAQDEGGRGMFNWELLYKRLPKLQKDLERPTEPFESPVMAGGLFAISSRFFWELGGYDEGLDIWGGEQYELSFKIWQCGGRMLDAPCSRVGHIYRKFAPFPNPRNDNFICQNFKRVAEVWMDEYKEYYYKRQPECRDVDAGDISKQIELRNRLKCKPFKWFMEEVAFELTKKFPLIDPPDIATGEVRSVAFTDHCIDMSIATLKLQKCIAGYEPQRLIYSWRGDIKMKGGYYCWDVNDYSNPKSPISLYECHMGGGNQLWKYDQKTQQLIHVGCTKCLDIEEDTMTLIVQQCDIKRKSQKWKMQNFNPDQSKILAEMIANKFFDK